MVEVANPTLSLYGGRVNCSGSIGRRTTTKRNARVSHWEPATDAPGSDDSISGAPPFMAGRKMHRLSAAG